jgi:hypothetical protein
MRHSEGPDPVFPNIQSEQKMNIVLQGGEK